MNTNVTPGISKKLELNPFFEDVNRFRQLEYFFRGMFLQKHHLNVYVSGMGQNWDHKNSCTWRSS